MAVSQIDNNGVNLGQLGNRNLVINGAMDVSQRGTSWSPPSDGYTIDRFQQYQGGGGVIYYEQSTDAPDGFRNSLKLTVNTADTSIGTGDYYYLRHNIEGYNVAQLSLGTSAAKQFTLSFYVKSSLTGTFSGAFQNASVNRTYIFEYTINSANTWERKTVTIAGDTTGTWSTDNTAGLRVAFDLGMGATYDGTLGSWTGNTKYSSTGSVKLVGTASATWQITGVQLEVGDTATPFEHRSYSDQLQSCMRYYQQINSGITGTGSNSGGIVFKTDFPVEMRAKPSVSLTDTDFRAGDMVAQGHTFTSSTVSASVYATARNYVVLLSGTANPSIVNYRTYLHEPDGSYPAAFVFDAEL
jgi:hypothetical protein